MDTSCYVHLRRPSRQPQFISMGTEACRWSQVASTMVGPFATCSMRILVHVSCPMQDRVADQLLSTVPSPAKGSPASPMLRSMGTEARRWSQVAALSPVQMGPTRCDPAKKLRLSTKGRSPSEPHTLRPRSSRPWAVAMWNSRPFRLWRSRCSTPPWCRLSLGIVICVQAAVSGCHDSSLRIAFLAALLAKRKSEQLRRSCRQAGIVDSVGGGAILLSSPELDAEHSQAAPLSRGLGMGDHYHHVLYLLQAETP